MNSSRPRIRGAAGASLVEVLVAVTIIAVAIAAVAQGMRMITHARETSSYYDSSKYIAQFVKIETARALTKNLEDSKGANCSGSKLVFSPSTIVDKLNATTANLRFSVPNYAVLVGKDMPSWLVNTINKCKLYNPLDISFVGDTAYFCLQIEFMDGAGAIDKDVSQALPFMLGSFGLQLINRKSGAAMSCAQFSDVGSTDRGFALHYSLDYQYHSAEPGAAPNTWQNAERYGHTEGDYSGGGHELTF